MSWPRCDRRRRRAASSSFCDACYSDGRRVRSVEELAGNQYQTRGRVPTDPGFLRVEPAAVILAAAQPFSLAAESDELEYGCFRRA